LVFVPEAGEVVVLDELPAGLADVVEVDSVSLGVTKGEEGREKGKWRRGKGRGRVEGREEWGRGGGRRR
jgi:hypothetical protein